MESPEGLNGTEERRLVALRIMDIKKSLYERDPNDKNVTELNQLAKRVLVGEVEPLDGLQEAEVMSKNWSSNK